MKTSTDQIKRFHQMKVTLSQAKDQEEIEVEGGKLK